MPFVSSNAPAMFQHALGIILYRVQWKPCIVYIDDVVIVSMNNCQHVKDIEEVVKLHRQAGKTLKLPRCHLIQKKIKYLDTLMHGRLAAASKKVDAIKAAVFPTDSTQMQAFLEYVICTEVSSKTFLKLLGNSMTIYGRTRNRIC